VSELAVDLRERAARVRLLVLDVDGVLTDGSLYYGPEGEAHKRFFVRDGMGIRLLHHHGVHVAVISARASKLVGTRMRDLGIKHWFTGQDDKVAALASILGDLALAEEQVAYVGDDILDVPVMRRVGFAVAVADAHPYAKQSAHFVTRALGGHGAVREVCDAIIEAQGGLANVYEKFLAHELGNRAMEKA
jgi:3-deoxy-D-manno-octulosonate 8-phosphate phosphatase (KDO 8-P phosphatase)